MVNVTKFLNNLQLASLWLSLIQQQQQQQQREKRKRKKKGTNVIWFKQ